MNAAESRPTPAGLISRLVARLREDGPVSDAAMAIGVLLVGVVFIAFDLVGLWTAVSVVDLQGSLRWWHLLPLALGAAAIMVKRRRPLSMLAVGVALFGIDLVIGGSLGMVLVLFDLLYGAAYHGTQRIRQWLILTAIIVVAALSVATGIAVGDPRATVMMVLQTGTVFILPLWWAADVRNRSELATLAAERADLEQARAANLRQIATLETEEAVQEERAAMARDLHDVIASHLSATAIHSGAALAGPPDSARDREALSSVRASSLAALEEMRSMIKLLRAGQSHTDQPVAPPSLAQLDDLIEDARGHGVEVEVSIRATDRLPAAVDQAAYRVVREALTNIIKHAPGSRSRLELATAPERLTIIIVNTLTQQPQQSLREWGTGNGLWSMRERVATLGGSLTAEREGQQWVVRGEVPLPSDRPAGMALT